MRVEQVEERQYSGSPGRSTAARDDPRRTYVEFTLEPVDTGTRLTGVESGSRSGGGRIPQGVQR
jgi:hypothetical protein